MIHICIYSFYKDDFLEDCLRSIANSSTENIFVDLYVFSREKINSERFELTKNIKVTILHKQKNFSCITNISLKKAKDNGATFFMLLNSDTILDVFCVQRLQLVLEEYKNIGVVGGYQTEYYSDKNIPNEWTKSVVKENTESNELLVGEEKLAYRNIWGAKLTLL